MAEQPREIIRPVRQSSGGFAQELPRFGAGSPLPGEAVPHARQGTSLCMGEWWGMWVQCVPSKDQHGLRPGEICEKEQNKSLFRIEQRSKSVTHKSRGLMHTRNRGSAVSIRRRNFLHDKMTAQKHQHPPPAPTTRGTDTGRAAWSVSFSELRRRQRTGSPWRVGGPQVFIATWQNRL